MTRIDRSPEQLDAEAQKPDLGQRILRKSDLQRCAECGNPYLEGYPHHHEKPQVVAYDPMPHKPKTRDGLVNYIRREYLAEVPNRIHVQQVPSHAEPIGVSQYSAEAAGWVTSEATIEVLDTGPLGSPPWSVPFHNRIGSYRMWEGEVVQSDDALHNVPWTRNLNGVRRWCTGKHRTWYEHRGEPLCWVLVRLVIEGGYSTGRAAELNGVSPEKANSLLDEALDKWWTWTANDLNDLTMRRVRVPAA